MICWIRRYAGDTYRVLSGLFDEILRLKLAG
jgi:hypothetical protein